MWSAPIRASQAGSIASGTRPPAAGSPRTTQIGMPAAAGSARSARPPSQSPLSRRTARAAGLVELGQRLGLATGRRPPTSRGARCGATSMRLRDVVVGPLGRVVGHLGDERVREGRRVEQDDGRRAEAGDRQGGRRDRAPAVADDLEVVDGEPGRPDEGGDVRGVVAEPMVALPVAGQAVPGQVDRDDPSTAGSQGRPDAPPARGVRRHAVDEQQRPIRRVAPDERRPRDAGGLDRDALARPAGRRGPRRRRAGGSARSWPGR